MQSGCQLVRDERDGGASKHSAVGRNPERRGRPGRGGRQHPDRTGLPEDHPAPSRRGGRGRRDGAAVAAQHEPMPSPSELATAPGAASGPSTSIGADDDRTSVHAPVLRSRDGGHEHAVILVDAARPLRSRRADRRPRSGRVGCRASPCTRLTDQRRAGGEHLRANRLIEGTPPAGSPRHACPRNGPGARGPALPAEEQARRPDRPGRRPPRRGERGCNGEQHRVSTTAATGAARPRAPVGRPAEQGLLGDGGQQGERQRPRSERRCGRPSGDGRGEAHRAEAGGEDHPRPHAHAAADQRHRERAHQYERVHDRQQPHASGVGEHGHAGADQQEPHPRRAGESHRAPAVVGRPAHHAGRRSAVVTEGNGGRARWLTPSPRRR